MSFSRDDRTSVEECLHAGKAPEWKCREIHCLFNRRGACITQGLIGKGTRVKTYEKELTKNETGI